MKFFFDNSIAARVARGLNGFVSPDHKVVHLKDQFAANTDDSVWMTQMAQHEEWIIVTANVRIGKNPHEIEAWKVAGHTIFFLKPGWLKMRSWDQAQKFVKAFPRIIETAERAKRGSIFTVGVNGTIET
jgi:hypothetical protein